MKKNSVLGAASRRLLWIVLALWLVGMLLLTWMAAADMLIQVRRNLEDYIINPPGRENTIDDYDPTLPGDMELNAMSAVMQLYPRLAPQRLFLLSTDPWLGGGLSNDSLLWGKWDLIFGLEPAVVYKNPEGEIIAESASFLSFCYSDGESARVPEGRGYILLEAGMEELERFAYSAPSYFGFYGPMNMNTRLRLTGTFHGSRFIPVQVDVCYGSVNTWENLLLLENNTQEPLVTLYAWDVNGFFWESRPVQAGGITYENLTAYAKGFDVAQRKDNLFSALICYGTYDTDVYGDYRMRVAVRFSPILYALLRLWPVYLGTFALACIGSWLYLRWLKRHLADPVIRLGVALQYGTPIRKGKELQEIEVLTQQTQNLRDAWNLEKDRVHQLTAALDYASHAEESRRQLTSDITHELKTPLAVIYSYAECLQEGVPAEKRDRYLAVILDEVRRMDDMVLQMLDLSRLEAGKVQLNRERLSLTELAEQSVSRFAPLLEGKNLTVTWEKREDILLSADRERLGQAVTNLLSNAVKYTPAGGRITVKLTQDNGLASFAVENPAKPLPDDVLEKVWDSFYRADPARREKGTGLGLSLVKNIVRLHGGTCQARNLFLRLEDRVETSVEFGFSIPLE